MANEEIKLVGSFKDNITPELKKLNKEIANIGRSFAAFNKKLAPVSKNFAKMAMSAKEFSNAMQTQRKAMDSSARSMLNYRKEAGKMAGAMQKVTNARTKAQRQMGMSRAEARKSGGAMPGMGGGKGGGRSGGASYGAAAAKGFNSGVGTVAIGSAIGNLASQAIMRGVSGIGKLLSAPFRKFAAAFGERISDEMDDIKSAGGMFALDRDLTGAGGNGNKALFKGFNDSLRFQEEINTRMAKSASNLPGTTSEFVAMNRRLTDTIQMVAETNREAFVKFGERQGADTSAGGTTAVRESMATVGQRLTESLMLASQGQQGGLPMDLAIQQLMGLEKGKFDAMPFTNKFRAAFQKNPLLKNFLMRAQEEINKTEAGSVERLELVTDLFARASPKDQVAKMKGSLMGLLESVRSGILDPQGGFFGLSRAVQEFDKNGKALGPLMKENVNLLGEKLYKFTDVEGINDLDGKPLEKNAVMTQKQIEELGQNLRVVNGNIQKGNKNIGSVDKSTTYLFEQIREIGANYGIVLTQFVGMLPSIFDPFAKMTKALLPLREKSVEFFNTFATISDQLDNNVEYLLKNAKTDADKGNALNLRTQISSRSALATVADFLGATGAMDIKQAEEIKKKMVSRASTSKEAVDAFDDTAAEAFKTMFDALMSSQLMTDIGSLFGTLVGGILETTFQVINGLFTGVFKKDVGNAFTKGFGKGFDDIFKDMGGFDGFMKKVNDLLAQMMDVATDFLVNKVLPALFRSLLQFITAGFKAGPMGSLISGGLILGLVLGVKAATGALWDLALSAKAAGLGTFGKMKGLRGIQGPQATAAGTKGLMSGGAIKTAFATLAKTITRIAPLLKKLSIWLAAILILGGGFENSLRQISSALGEVFRPLWGTVEGAADAVGQLTELIVFPIRELGREILKLFGMTQQGTNSLDLLRIALIPLTATLQLLEIAFKGLAEVLAWANMKIKEFWGSDKEKQEATAAYEKAKGAREDAMTRHDIYNTSMRYGGEDNYMKIVKGDLAGKQAKLAENQKSGVSTMADKQLMDDIKYLQNRIRVFEEGGGSKTVSTDTPAPEETTKALTSVTENGAAAGEQLQKTVPELKALETQAQTTADVVKTSLEGAVTDAGAAITQAAKSLAAALSGAAASIKNAASASGGSSEGSDLKGVKPNYKGSNAYSRGMGLGDAISTEMKHKPPGSDLVIANSSETIIPAFSGNAGEGFKNFSFEQLESAAGFNRMASYTDQIREIADKTAESFSGGGPLGGGSATLNAMEALGHAGGLTTTSGFRPGDPGFHGANRARDLSDGAGETPGMNKVAAEMASKYGASLTELIYTPLGYSIKNGQKTGLISPDNHYHHIHVAVAEGLANAAVFSSEQAAMAYEKSMMPGGASPMKVDLSSMTANSSEFSGGGGLTVGDVHVNVSGVDNPKEIATVVADEILAAVQRATYTELHTS